MFELTAIDVIRQGNVIIIDYKDGKRKVEPYTKEQYKYLLREILIYHKERIAYHEQYGKSLFKRLEKL